MNDKLLPAKASQTTRENPWPLALLSQKMKEYVDKAPECWIVAEVIEYRKRAAKSDFFSLKDLKEDCGFQAVSWNGCISELGDAFVAGARVVAKVKPNLYKKTGSLSVRVDEIYLEGSGLLMLKLEKLKKKLAAEGLFRRERKKPLPFIPHTIGLICGSNAKAKEDVIVNATKRWPGVSFEIREVRVQGEESASEVTQALVELESLEQVEVIIITRGGGSFEDLLPFSDEGLVRTAAACLTPLISAIGHEEDVPLLDLVADYRASTPTDAAKNVVPDYQQLVSELADFERRLYQSLLSIVDREKQQLELIASHPFLANPLTPVEIQEKELAMLEKSLTLQMEKVTLKEKNILDSLAAKITTLSPRSTLTRGYSILMNQSNKVIKRASALKQDDTFTVVLGTGALEGKVTKVGTKKTLNIDVI